MAYVINPLLEKIIVGITFSRPFPAHSPRKSCVQPPCTHTIKNGGIVRGAPRQPRICSCGKLELRPACYVGRSVPPVQKFSTAMSTALTLLLVLTPGALSFRFRLVAPTTMPTTTMNYLLPASIAWMCFIASFPCD